MRLKVLYLARLRDVLGRGSEELDVPAASTVGALIDHLRQRGDPWARELAAGRAFRVAVNQEMSASAAALSDGDEVALFLPVTGG
ncbi:MAG: MoaD/ThiS family protein [Casimicrobiaceae bacterium]